MLHITQQYMFRVEDSVTGCFSIAQFNLLLIPQLNIIPQGISPNNDGLNDVFDLTGYQVTSMKIFNRNGAEVYVKSDGYTKEWYGQSKNGDDLPTGTYYYVMKYGNNQVKAHGFM